MKESDKSRSFRRIFSLYLERYLLHKHFRCVMMKGTVDPNEKLPVLYIANHSSWWDGLIIFLLTEKASELDHYMMMEEKQLKQYAFFRKLGAFPVQKENLKSVKQALMTAKENMQAGRAVWLFPQGKIMHQDMRPLELEGGASFLVRQFEQVVVKPVTLHYTFNQFQKPTVSAVFGEDTLVSGGEFRSKGVTHLLRDLLETQLNTHQAQVIADPAFSTNQEFRQMTRTSQSTSDAFDSFKKWVKTWRSS
ncbi:lysophospholipid acyltransferase family protein [Bacillus safensis]|uniref:lysophospholipid acyltransferase family protein n=1 Tax=Bacillus safensis TaxID=561879 RepID=UPI0022376629|nr:lysophospholipid acyltransferase family protein [Bacillus safensis]MCW4643419.1 lysophospholipid acyltransferase family protein [Bacillus safensis]MCY7563531.1 lysophospholipid acyltransferase family protein [Bacillus safensis]MCY7626503.1 lysophospholipid acyltransferase family protein [Bacillus safensis]MCY7652484.1 lysophospholipid acyltransferase family protein [Bacillus safensis]MCY7661258.1 lysophospholipid acyltransferase family protein [Bacillus safensis]